jgi:predicted nucleic acid-binding protein
MNEKIIEGVFDAGPIIHLDEIGCLELLADFRCVMISEMVWKEVEMHRPGVLEWLGGRLRPLRSGFPKDEKLQALCKAFCLDRGEMEALAILEQNAGAILFTDDAAARLVAERSGYRAHGTIGILLRSIRRGQKSAGEVVEILQTKVPLSSLLIKRSLLDGIIEAVKKESRI